MRAVRNSVVSRFHSLLAVLLLNSLLLLALTATAHANGPEFDYLLHCGGCHIENGSGMPPAIPDLRDQLGYFASFPAGREYLVQVPGVSQAPINDEQLAEVLNWMLRTFVAADIETALPFNAEEVGRYRGDILLNAASRREELLALQ